MATKLHGVFRENVQRLLTEYGWTRTDLAAEMDVTKGYVSQVMTAHRGIGLEAVDRFAKALGVEPSALISENNSSKVTQKAG